MADPPMRDTYIVSDIHGDYEALVKVLLDADLLVDKPGRGLVKRRDAFVCQIGDLANCVYNSVQDDLKCLNLVASGLIDMMLVGNHEIPYFDPNNTFSGFHHSYVVSQTLWELYVKEKIQPCLLIGDTLVTHAGITRSQLGETTAKSVADKLEELWRGKHFSHHWFSDCGRARWGNAETGGVLWCDFDDEFEPTDFPQIVGHTPQGLHIKGNALCIDSAVKNGGTPTILKVGG